MDKGEPPAAQATRVENGSGRRHPGAANRPWARMPKTLRQVMDRREAPPTDLVDNPVGNRGETPGEM